MTRGCRLFLVAIAALAFLAQGACAKAQCSATKPCADRTNCCSRYFYCDKGPAYCGAGCLNGPCTGRTVPAPPGGGSGWSSFLTKAFFDKYFPNRIPFYTYEGFRTAAKAYPGFGRSGTLAVQKRELAAFLANLNQESGGLTKTEEDDRSGTYCQKKNKQYPCVLGKKYYGRGPLQLSWNYNYGAFSADLNIRNLLANPEKVSRNSTIAWQSALWFWMNNGPHTAILRNSFSGTIRAINGQLECAPTATVLGKLQMANRVKYYKELCARLGVKPGIDLQC